MGSASSTMPAVSSERALVAASAVPSSPVKQQRRKDSIGVRRHPLRILSKGGDTEDIKADDELPVREYACAAGGDTSVELLRPDEPGDVRVEEDASFAAGTGVPTDSERAPRGSSPPGSESSSSPFGDEEVYAGELVNLNDGIVGVDPAVRELALRGNESAQRAMIAAEMALGVFRREVPLVVTPEHLDDLAPEVPVTDVDAQDSCSCLVCQDSWHPGELKRCLPCGHEFHSKCAMEWLSKNVGSCPVCRSALQPSLTELECTAWRSALADAEALAAAEISMQLDAISEDGGGGNDADGGADGGGAGGGDGGAGRLGSAMSSLDAAELSRRAHAMANGVAPEGLVSPIQAQLYNHHLAVLYANCRLALPWEMRCVHLDATNQAWLAHRAGVGRAQMGMRS